MPSLLELADESVPSDDPAEDAVEDDPPVSEELEPPEVLREELDEPGQYGGGNGSQRPDVVLNRQRYPPIWAQRCGVQNPFGPQSLQFSQLPTIVWMDEEELDWLERVEDDEDERDETDDCDREEREPPPPPVD